MRRPNVLILLTHDSGRYFGCYGVETVRTPHIDALARGGVLLEQFSAASPICSPSRGTMFTGRQPQRNGLMGLTHHGFRLHPGERHAAAIFRDAGYATTLFHFQHVAERGAWGELGFEDSLMPSRDEEFPDYPDMAIPAGELANGVGEWLATRSREDRPFFALVNFNETHTPFEFGGVTPDTERGVTVPAWIEPDAGSKAHFAMLQGSVAALDAGVGRILDSLEDAGLADDTIVVFATDHGFEAMRDKWTLYESGVGIAGMFRHLALAPGHRVTTPHGNVDFLPTLLDLAGIEGPGNLDGESFADELRGAPADARPVFAVYHNTGCRSVRDGDWKLIRNFAAEPYQQDPPVSLARRKPARARPPLELYNLAHDPDEFVNLAASEPATVARLSGLLAEWMRKVGDPV